MLSSGGSWNVRFEMNTMLIEIYHIVPDSASSGSVVRINSEHHLSWTHVLNDFSYLPPVHPRIIILLSPNLCGWIHQEDQHQQRQLLHHLRAPSCLKWLHCRQPPSSDLLRLVLHCLRSYRRHHPQLLRFGIKVGADASAAVAHGSIDVCR